MDSGGHVPEVEGPLYLKSEGKKAWKRFFFVLRASGIYYNPKGKSKVNFRDVCYPFSYISLFMSRFLLKICQLRFDNNKK